MSPQPSRVPVPGDITPDALAALRNAENAPQSREARYYAAVHRDTVLRGAQAAMALADEELREARATIARVEAMLGPDGPRKFWIGEPDGWAVLTSDVRAALAATEGPAQDDDTLARRLEWATGRNGHTLLEQLRAEGLEVMTVTEEQS